MIYEIGWTRYDMTDFIIAACFIPVLIGFIIFIKKYKTEKGNFEKDGIIGFGGSKSHTKFVVNAILIILMIFSLSSMVKIFIKYKTISNYKNGKYEMFTGTVSYSLDRYIVFENEFQHMYLYESYYNKGVKDIIEKERKDGEEYTVYFTSNYSNTIILRIDENIENHDKP